MDFKLRRNIMNKIKKCFLSALGLSLILVQSCDLDREPNDFINFNNSYKTVEDAKMWDNGIYSTLRGKFGGAYILTQEVQADMLNAHALYGGSYGTFHGWDVKAEDNIIKEIYHSYYAAIVDANIVIKEGPVLLQHLNDKISSESDNASTLVAQQAKMKEYIGNAYFARAFYYFNLAIRWGMPYKEATAAEDLCVPLETKPFDLRKPARNTNAQVYNLILSDLQKAEEGLSTVPCVEGNDEISADAVRAFRSRVYLYMNKMDEALAEAEALIENQKYPLIEALAEGAVDPAGKENPFIKMWHYDNGREQIWQPFVDKPNEVPTTTGLYGADLNTWQYWENKGVSDKDFNAPPYLPSGSTMYDLYVDPRDRRIPAYFEAVWTTLKEKEDQAVVFVVSKFKGNPKFRSLDSPCWGGYVPNGICSPKPFRIAEQYLISSEAAYSVGNQEVALKRLNELRASRGMNGLSLSGEDLLKAIRDERTRELAYEGFRLWDLRRWHMAVPARERQGMRKEHIVPVRFFAEGYSFTEEIPVDNPKFIWGFPKEEVFNVNKNIKQNPGW